MMDNSLYRERYGSWAGRPGGSKPDFTRCCEEVYRKIGMGGQFGQCSKPRGHGPASAYCKTHDPAAVNARKAASDDAYRKRFNKERYGYHGRVFFEALKKIAEGHNDARGLAQEVIAKFEEGMKK